MSTSDPTRPPEPDWVEHAIWWQVYPLGAVGAFPEPPGGPATPEEHRLLRLVPWLDHAVELGASGIALGPVFASSTHGYDTTDHLRLDPRLGEDGDLDVLVREAHERGLRVQLDGVFNHVGREHPLVQEVLTDGIGSPAARLLRVEDGPDGPRFGSFEGHEALVALDHDSPEVERLVVDVLRHWLDRGVDAWRLDAAYAVPETFWARVLPQVRESHPDVWFEAEVIHGDYAGFVTGSTADSVTQYELWKAVWSSITDGNFHELDWTLTRHDEFLEVFVPATFVGNHDVTRIASRIEDGRHLAHAHVLLATLGGTPRVYAGDEYAFRGVKEDRAGGDDAVRPELPADGPAGLEGPDLEVERVHRELLGLRRRHPWLHRARHEVRSLSNTQYVLEVVGDAQDRLVVALNLDDEPLDPGAVGDRLAADEASSALDSGVAPHGWSVFAPA